MTKTKHQRFEYREVHRSEIHAAPYNPRQMSRYAKSLLSKKIASDGCIQALVWNESTGNLVGGHQRLDALDELEGNLDYSIGVAVVRLDPKQERELNVFLNNYLAQGDWDKDAFFAMVNEGLDITAAGFTTMDIELEFSDLPDLLKTPGFTGLSDQQATAEALNESLDTLEKPKKTKEEWVAMRKAAGEKRDSKPHADYEYFLIGAFNNAAQKESFMRRIGATGQAYITAEQLKPFLQEGLID